jgi:hypothetical protein
MDSGAIVMCLQMHLRQDLLNVLLEDDIGVRKGVCSATPLCFYGPLLIQGVR